MGLSEYERRMWADLEARLIGELRQPLSLGSATRAAMKLLAGAAVAVLVVVLAVVAGDAALIVFTLLFRVGNLALWALAAAAVAAVLLLRRTGPQRS